MHHTTHPPTRERSLVELLPPVPPLPARLSPRRLPCTVRLGRVLHSAWLHVMHPDAAPEPGTGALAGGCLAAGLALSYAITQIITGGTR